MCFVAVDVETANADLTSICQIGTALFVGDQSPKLWQSYVNPQDYFDPVNVSVHGISQADVGPAPTFPEIHPRLFGLFEGQVVVTHTHFDRVALRRACDKHGLSRFSCSWLDSARVARRAWPNLSDTGYGLASVCRHLSIRFEHHVAGEDARAAGEIVSHAAADTGLGVTDWLKRVGEPIRGTIDLITQDGDPVGPLAGETIVFTGALSIPRRIAASKAATTGCDVARAVTRKTTLLVVGDQDVRRLAGHEKSAKHRKAEKLIQKGQPIRILTESDFFSLIEEV